MKKQFDGDNETSLRNLLTESVRINPNIGSSTAVLATLKNNTLMTLNLGDSGYLILRPDYNKPRSLSTVFKSKE